VSIDLGMPRLDSSGTAFVPVVPEGATALTRKDFTSDQDVRWCPGCGDYAILAAIQGFLPELGLLRENIVFISGIGCSSRFPYYVDTYGMHSIHGRAPTFATGLATAREDLSVWVVTGDGDSLSIGGNHLIHALRRNVNIKILLFNNEIYGLTKGQYSPTSRAGTVSKSSPLGSLDRPFTPVSVALGAEATFVARTMDSERKHMTEVLHAAARHRGAAFVEIYQNCPIFNDGAFDVLKDKEQAAARILWLRDGEEVSAGDQVAVRSDDGSIRVVPRAEASPTRIVTHAVDTEHPSSAFALSRLTFDGTLAHVPMGVFRSVTQPTYDDMVRGQVQAAVDAAGGPATDADLTALLAGHDTWSVEE